MVLGSSVIESPPIWVYREKDIRSDTELMINYSYAFSLLWVSCEEISGYENKVGNLAIMVYNVSLGIVAYLISIDY